MCAPFRRSKASVTAWTVLSAEENGTTFHYKFPRRTHHLYSRRFLCTVGTGPVCCPSLHGLPSIAIGVQFVGSSRRQSTPRADRSLQSVSHLRCSGDLRSTEGKFVQKNFTSRQFGKKCALLFKGYEPMQMHNVTFLSLI